MATTKKPVKKMQGGGTTKKPIVLRPDYRNLQLARSYNNAKVGNKLNTPATKQDSTNYKIGFIRGVKGWKPSADRLKYEGEGEYQKMGRWEGQNMKKEALSKKKTSGKTTKAKNGTSLGMKSVKAGFDKNPGVTRADIITAATKKAKSGTKVKKAGLGDSIKGLFSNGGAGKMLGGFALGSMLGGRAKSGSTVKKAQMGSFVTNEFAAKNRAFPANPKPKSTSNTKLLDSSIKKGKAINAFQGKKGMVAKSGTSVKKAQNGWYRYNGRLVNDDVSISRMHKVVKANSPKSNKGLKPIKSSNENIIHGGGSPSFSYKRYEYKKPVTNHADSLKAYNSTKLLDKESDRYSSGYRSGGSVKKCKYGCK